MKDENLENETGVELEAVISQSWHHSVYQLNESKPPFTLVYTIVFQSVIQSSNSMKPPHQSPFHH